MLDRFRETPVIGVVVVAAEEFAKDRASRTAAALAYYTLFSLSPLLFLAVGLAGLVFGNVTDELRAELEAILPSDIVEVIISLVVGADAGAGLAFVLASLLALWSGSAVFVHLRRGLDDMFEVASEETGGVVRFLRLRLIGSLGVIGVGIVLVLLLAGNAALGSVDRLLPDEPAWIPSLVEIGSPLLSFFVVWLVFALVFRYLPAVRMPWKAVRRGSAFTAAAFLVSAVGVGWFVGRFGVGGAVGAASSVAVLLYIAFLLGQVVLFGAEVTAAYAGRLAETSRAVGTDADVDGVDSVDGVADT